MVPEARGEQGGKIEKVADMRVPPKTRLAHGSGITRLWSAW
jgi:hypothetical protein